MPGSDRADPGPARLDRPPDPRPARPEPPGPPGSAHGRVIRRYERSRPGELVHVDVKKPGRIPGGGGWRVHDRAACPDRRRTTGYDYIHASGQDT